MKSPVLYGLVLHAPQASTRRSGHPDTCVGTCASLPPSSPRRAGSAIYTTGRSQREEATAARGPRLRLQWTSFSGPQSPVAAPRSSQRDRKSTRLNSSHVAISYAVFCLKKKKPLNAAIDRRG